MAVVDSVVLRLPDDLVDMVLIVDICAKKDQPDHRQA